MIFRHALSPYTPESPAVASARCFTAGGRLRHFRKRSHSHFVYRGRFGFTYRYGSRRRRSRLRTEGYPTVRSIGYVLNGQLHGGYLSIHQINPSFAWRTGMTVALVRALINEYANQATGVRDVYWVGDLQYLRGLPDRVRKDSHDVDAAEHFAIGVPRQDYRR